MRKKTEGAGELIRVWNDWSAGIGYSTADENRPGMYNAIGILGGRGELRPAMHKYSMNISAATSASNLVMGYYFDVQTSGGGNVSNTLGSYGYPVMRDITTVFNGNVLKLDYRNATFGTLIQENDADSAYGQPAFYAGDWHIGSDPQGIGTSPIIRRLSTVGTSGGGDTWSEGDVDSGGTRDLLIPTGNQLVRCTRFGRIRMSVPGEDVLQEANWGSSFLPTADVTNEFSYIKALFSLDNSLFMLSTDGLLSFNKSGRIGVVNNDYNRFASTFSYIFTAAWRGGVVYPDRGGLRYYRVGNEPIYIGPESRLRSGGNIVPAAVTELSFGIYHGVASVGDYLFTIYQPVSGVATAYLMVGYFNDLTNDIAWQVINDLSLKSPTGDQFYVYPHGVGVSTVSRPESTTRYSPIVLFTDEEPGTTHLSYMILDPTGSPFRSGGNTHRITTSGDAWLSEEFWPDTKDPSHLVVYTDNMVSGDEWQLSFVNDSGADINCGAPIIGNGRHVRELGLRSVQTSILHINWASTSTASRIAPRIRRIELWG